MYIYTYAYTRIARIYIYIYIYIHTHTHTHTNIQIHIRVGDAHILSWLHAPKVQELLHDPTLLRIAQVQTVVSNGHGFVKQVDRPDAVIHSAVKSIRSFVCVAQNVTHDDSKDHRYR